MLTVFKRDTNIESGNNPRAELLRKHDKVKKISKLPRFTITLIYLRESTYVEMDIVQHCYLKNITAESVSD